MSHTLDRCLTLWSTKHLGVLLLGTCPQNVLKPERLCVGLANQRAQFSWGWVFQELRWHDENAGSSSVLAKQGAQSLGWNI